MENSKIIINLDITMNNERAFKNEDIKEVLEKLENILIKNQEIHDYEIKTIEIKKEIIE